MALSSSLLVSGFLSASLAVAQESRGDAKLKRWLFANSCGAQVETVSEVLSLVQRLEHGEKDAMEGLVAMGSKAVGTLLALKDRKGVSEALLAIGPAGVGELLRCDGSDTLRSMGPAVLPILVEEWRKRPLSSRAAVITLDEFGAAATPYLIELLSSEHSELRNAAGNILSMSLDPAAKDAMMRILNDSRDGPLQMYAAQYMQRRGDRDGAVAFLRLAVGAHPGLREDGLVGLGAIYEPAYLPTILNRAKWDLDAAVRSTAATILENRDSALLKRVGRRYKPLSVDPAAAQPLARVTLLLIAVSFGLLTFLTWFRNRSLDRGNKGAAGVFLAATSGCGFVWGFVLRGISGVEELAMLVGVVPLAFLLTSLLRSGDASRLRALWKYVASPLGFYGGYAIGQTVLWGGSLA